MFCLEPCQPRLLAVVRSDGAQLPPPAAGNTRRAGGGGPRHLRTARVARWRTRGSSPASRSAPLKTGAGSCRPVTAGRRGSRPRPPRPPRACSRRGRPRAWRRGAVSVSGSSSYDHSIVARSVRWRSGASRAPPVNSGSRCSSRSRICRGESAFTRAAASSSASGRSSRRPQISATASSRRSPA